MNNHKSSLIYKFRSNAGQYQIDDILVITGILGKAKDEC